MPRKSASKPGPHIRRQWIKSEVTSESLADASNLKCLHKRLLHKDEIPEFETRQLKLDDLMEEGDRLVHEVRAEAQ